MATVTYTNGEAPTNLGTYRLGAKGGRMAQAWQQAWDQLSRTEWTDGLELARTVAEANGLKPISVTEMFCRMRAAGALEQEMLPASTTYLRGGKEYTAQRKRVHYRIAADVNGLEQDAATR
jgi:hypothetical protein